MLKSDRRTERVRKPGRRRWWPLLLVPPLVLLAWALVGMNLTFGRYRLLSGWTTIGSQAIIDNTKKDVAIYIYATPVGGYVIWTPIVDWSLPVGSSEYFVALDAGSNPSSSSTPATRALRPPAGVREPASNHEPGSPIR